MVILTLAAQLKALAQPRVQGVDNIFSNQFGITDTWIAPDELSF